MCSRVVDIGSLLVHFRVFGEQWVVDLLQQTTTLMDSKGRWNSISALSRCLGKVDYTTLLVHCYNVGTTGHWNAILALPYGWAVIHGTLLQSIGHWNSFGPLPHCWGAFGSVTSYVHCHTIWSQWPPYTATLPGRKR